MASLKDTLPLSSKHLNETKSLRCRSSLTEEWKCLNLTIKWAWKNHSRCLQTSTTLPRIIQASTLLFEASTKACNKKSAQWTIRQRRPHIHPATTLKSPFTSGLNPQTEKHTRSLSPSRWASQRGKSVCRSRTHLWSTSRSLMSRTLHSFTSWTCLVKTTRRSKTWTDCTSTFKDSTPSSYEETWIEWPSSSKAFILTASRPLKESKLSSERSQATRLTSSSMR